MKPLELIESIKADVEQRYGSLANPRYDFVAASLKRQPYEPLIVKIKQFCNVDEQTDSNYDVSFIYHLSCEDSQFLLLLSMVGNYAVVFQIPSKGMNPVVIRKNQNMKSILIDKIFSILDEYQVIVLDDRITAQPIPFSLSEKGSECTIFHAIFTEGMF